jgi:hypothetical protein
MACKGSGSIGSPWTPADPARLGGGVRFARLTHRRVRAFGPAFGQRPFGVNLSLSWVATQGDALRSTTPRMPATKRPRSRWTSHRGPVRYRVPEPEVAQHA